MPKKILVIDDEPEIAELVQDCLEGRGFQILKAAHADEGMAIAQREKPDLILLDILLPKIGGLECLKLLKQKFPDAVVVILSGIQNESVAKEAIMRGAYDYITKPFDLEKFEDQILTQIFPS